MKKRILSLLLVLCTLISLLQTVIAADNVLLATPSETAFVMNGKPVSVSQAYTVNGTNYLQLRALAALLNGTSAQFDVGWDGQYAVIEPGKPYSGTVTETILQNTTDIRISDTKFKMGDKVFTFDNALLINGDTNYLQLREFAQKMGGTASQFNVYWDNSAGQAVIVPGESYTGVAPTNSSGKVNYNEEDVTWIGTESEYKKTLESMFDSGLRKVPVGDLQPDGSLKNVKYGLVDKYGNFMAQPIYDEIKAKYHAIDSTKKPVESIFVDGYVQAVRNGKMGLLDTSGKEVIPCVYDAVGLPSEGVSRIIKTVNGVNYLGYWNLELGKEIVAPNKYIIDKYSANAEGELNTSFERRTIGNNRYAAHYDFNGGYALVPTGKTEKVTQVLAAGAGTDKTATLVYAQIINKYGNEILSKAYPYRQSFMSNSPYPQAGPYMVYQELSTKRLRMITDHRDEVIFSSHLESGIVGPQGIIVPAQYHGGIWGSAGNWYPVDAQIRIIPELSMAITFKCGDEGFKESAAVPGVISLDNRELSSFDKNNPIDSYDPEYNIFIGYALYKTDLTKLPGSDFSVYYVNGYYNITDDYGNHIGVGSVKTGETYTHENLHSEDESYFTTRSHVSSKGTVWIRKNINGEYLWGLVNLQGQILLPFEYEEVYVPDEEWAGDEFAIIQKNGRWGLVDAMGTTLLPCIYKSIDNASDGYFNIVDYNTKKHGMYSMTSRKITVPCEYDSYINVRYSETGTGAILGTVTVSVGDKIEALLDLETGKILTPTTSSISPTELGLFYSSNYDYYGPDGKIVFPRSETITYYNGRRLSTGEDLTIVVKDGKVGYINASRLASEGRPLPTTPRVKPVPMPLAVKYYLVEYPDKQLYKVGDEFDITGLVIHYEDENGHRGIVDNSQLTFITSKTVELYQGRKFTSEGVKVVEVSHNGNKAVSFQVKVIKDSDGSILDSGDYYLQVLGKYIYPVKASGTYWLELSDKKPEKPYKIKLIDYDKDRGPKYTISYDGIYIMQPTTKNGAQLMSSNVPHMWRINKYASFCTIRDYGNQKMLVNASGEKNTNGTKVIIWSSTGSAPDHGKIKFIKAD